MKVTIIGAGNMGRGIGTRAVVGGNDVEIIDRDAAEAQTLAEELQKAATGGASAAAVESGGAISGDIVVLAMYYPSSSEAVEQYAEQLAGKVVVDISNPVDVQTFDRLVTPPTRRQPRRPRGWFPREPRSSRRSTPRLPARLSQARPTARNSTS